MLRYDALYDRLSPAERRGLEHKFRDFIKHHCEEEKLQFTRTSWLPNMQWPRPLTAHLMAVALRDEKLIRRCFASRGGRQCYFDDYLADRPVGLERPLKFECGVRGEFTVDG